MKLLDVWLFFGLILPFIAFCLEVAEELIVSLEQEDNDDEQPKIKPIRVLSSASVHPEKVSQIEVRKESLSPKLRLIQFLARVFLPILTIVFILAYLAVCIYSYNNPTLVFD